MTKRFQLDTPRLTLLSCDEAIYLAMLRSNTELSQLLNIEVPEGWSEFGIEPYAWSSVQLQKDPENHSWLTYLVIHQADNKMIGTAGFKGKPDAAGLVEIGYGISPTYRRQGIAGEAARALIDYAFQQKNVSIVQAHTLAEENASVKLLKKIGMQFIQELYDTEDGDIWQWQVKREAYFLKK